DLHGKSSQNRTQATFNPTSYIGMGRHRKTPIPSIQREIDMLFNPIKDQTIDGLEEWLKNNKPTVIPCGASTATGYTPPAPSERTQQESKQRAQEINKMIRAENAAKKSEARSEERRVGKECNARWPASHG